MHPPKAVPTLESSALPKMDLPYHLVSLSRPISQSKATLPELHQSPRTFLSTYRWESFLLNEGAVFSLSDDSKQTDGVSRIEELSNIPCLIKCHDPRGSPGSKGRIEPSSSALVFSPHAPVLHIRCSSLPIQTPLSGNPASQSEKL